MKQMSRSRVIQVWFAAVTLVLVAAVTIGTPMTIGTGAVLLALSVVPAAIVFKLWPGPEPATVAEVLYGPVDRRA